MTVAVGTKAPDFTLPNQDLQPVTLSAHLGRKNTVLAFFPAAFTSVCTKEMCTFRYSIARLNTADAVVYGISVDTPFTLKVFAKEQGLTFPLLSDFNKDVIHRYGVVIEDLLGLKGLARRAVFVIDKAGVIRYSEVLENAGSEPDYARLMGALAGLA
ncbi:MAG: peroxiredoxin [Chloroflexi bacterium]|nr:peroxiredoxin [Chloroflexota bacterium]